MRVRVPAACILLSLGILGSWVGPHGRSSEQDRVTTHLTRALEAMAEDAPAGLTADQKAARVETITWLGEYRDAGRFPHNHVTSGRTPVFVDPHGTPCAVGYLLLRSGESELVEDIVRTDNLIRVRDLEGDPRLGAWLEARGITLEEAATIQPAYDGGRPGIYVPSSYTTETIALGLASAAAFAFTEFTEPSVEGVDWPAWLSLGGMVGHSVLLGAIATQGGGAPAAESVVNGTGAILGLVVAARRFNRRSDLQERSVVTLAPWVDPRSGGVGIQVAIRR